MTAAAAVNGIREVDSDNRIGLISAEPDAPYDRPPLSKALWKGKSLDTIWRNVGSQTVDIHLGRLASAVDTERHTVFDDRRDAYTYGKLLFATGGSPRRLPFGEGSIIYFRNLSDYRWLRALTEHGRRFAVIGAGFIGSEIGAALAMTQKEVVMIFPGQGICDRVFPSDLRHFLNDYYQKKGVELWAGETVHAVERRGERFAVRTQSGRESTVDGVVAGIGITPNIRLAQLAGLSVENGIVVDEMLRTTQPDVFAAGDVAAFFNPALGKRLRVEHEDNANTMGRLAGRNMAGKAESYHHLPSFYSDLFELGYEAVGELDARLDVRADWKDKFHEGVLYYQQEGRVRGVLLWNVWGKVDAARELIGGRKTLRSDDIHQALTSAA